MLLVENDSFPLVSCRTLTIDTLVVESPDGSVGLHALLGSKQSAQRIRFMVIRPEAVGDGKLASQEKVSTIISHQLCNATQRNPQCVLRKKLWYEKVNMEKRPIHAARQKHWGGQRNGQRARQINRVV